MDMEERDFRREEEEREDAGRERVRQGVERRGEGVGNP